MRTSQRVAAVLAAGALALNLSVSALAQNRTRGGSTTVPQALLAKLSLSDDQKAKVKAAGDAYRADSAKASALTGNDEKRAARKKARDDYKAAMQAALTPDQQKQLQSMMDEAKQYEGMGTMHYQLVGMTPPLTDEQKSKITAIKTKYEPDLDKARAETRTATDKAAARQALNALYAKIGDEVKAVLTPDQQRLLQPARRRKQNQ